jgi:hypothetical protein
MKTILHFTSWEDMNQANKKTILGADLVTYDIQTMNGEYNPRVMVYKSRHTTGQGYTITQEQARILQDCVLNGKTSPDFMNLEKLRNQECLYRVGSVEEAREILNKVSNREILDEVARRNDINRRLKKLEDDLFPAGYVDCTGLETFHSVPVKERLSRIERKLGVVQSPGDDLGRLEQCEFHLKNVYWRLNRLDEEIYPTRKDIYAMPATITLDGWMEKLEKKLGVNLAFTDMNHRLKHIEDAWSCTKAAASYVCPVLKDQKELQDALQKQFGDKKIYEPKYKPEQKLQVMGAVRTIKNLMLSHDCISDTYRWSYIFYDGTHLCCDWVDANPRCQYPT